MIDLSEGRSIPEPVNTFLYVEVGRIQMEGYVSCKQTYVFSNGVTGKSVHHEIGSIFLLTSSSQCKTPFFPDSTTSLVQTKIYQLSSCEVFVSNLHYFLSILVWYTLWIEYNRSKPWKTKSNTRMYIYKVYCYHTSQNIKVKSKILL